MIKIGIYCGNRVQKKEIKNILTEYFDAIQLKAEITSFRTRVAALKDVVVGYIDYNIIIICEENKLTYFKKNIVNYFKSYSNITVGWLSIPFNMDKIEEIIFNEDYHNCPSGVYKLITNKIIRAVPYSDISFFRWNGEKTILHLKDYETEELKPSIKKIKEKLPENYFAECIKGYIINLYSVKKIDKTNHEFVMYSGHRISISDRKYKEMVRLYIEVMFGI
jgi:hypothetical protein